MKENSKKCAKMWAHTWSAYSAKVQEWDVVAANGS